MTEDQARLLIRISESLKAKLAELAKRERRSLNKQIEFLLDRAVREEENRQTGAPLARGGRRQK